MLLELYNRSPSRRPSPPEVSPLQGNVFQIKDLLCLIGTTGFRPRYNPPKTPVFTSVMYPIFSLL